MLGESTSSWKKKLLFGLCGSWCSNHSSDPRKDRGFSCGTRFDGMGAALLGLVSFDVIIAGHLGEVPWSLHAFAAGVARNVIHVEQ